MLQCSCCFAAAVSCGQAKRPRKGVVVLTPELEKKARDAVPPGSSGGVATKMFEKGREAEPPACDKTMQTEPENPQEETQPGIPPPAIDPPSVAPAAPAAQLAAAPAATIGISIRSCAHRPAIPSSWSKQAPIEVQESPGAAPRTPVNMGRELHKAFSQTLMNMQHLAEEDSQQDSQVPQVEESTLAVVDAYMCESQGGGQTLADPEWHRHTQLNIAEDESTLAYPVDFAAR